MCQKLCLLGRESCNLRYILGSNFFLSKNMCPCRVCAKFYAWEVGGMITRDRVEIGGSITRDRGRLVEGLLVIEGSLVGGLLDIEGGWWEDY